MDVVFLHAGGGVHEVVERDRHRNGINVREGRPEEEVVPDIRELPDDRHHDDRRRGGQQDTEEDAEEPRPVDLRRPDQLGREGGVVVAEKERREAKPIDDMDKDKPRNGARQPQNAQHPRHRDQHDLKRDEAGQKQHREDDPVALEAPLGQDIAVQRAKDGRDRDGGNHHHDGVQEIRLQPRRLYPDLGL